MLVCSPGFGDSSSLSLRLSRHPSSPPRTVSSSMAPVWLFAQSLQWFSPLHTPALPTGVRDPFRNQEFGLSDYCSLTPAKRASLSLPLCLLSLSSSGRQISLLRCHLLQGPQSGSSSVLFCRLQSGVCMLTPCLGSGYMNSLQPRLVLTPLPWDVHRIVSRSWRGGAREPARGVEGVDIEKTFRAFGGS